MFPVRVKKTGIKTWTKQEIKEILLQARIKRARAIVLFLVASGYRIDALSDPWLKHAYF